MEGSSSKGSSKRKPAFTMKMTKKRVESDSDEDDFSDAVPVKKGKGNGHNSEYSDNDSIPELPEGTVIVKPEAVKEKKPRFSGPEFSKAPENLEIVSCTACGRQINPNVSGAAKRHPDLKVLVCRKCYVYYRSGKIEQDEDGLDEQCRWCGEGGRLSGCDYCHNAFCKSCIIRNFTRAELTKIMAEDDSKWKCYVCEPKSLKKLLKECDELFKKIEIEKIKAKNASSRKEDSSRPSRESSRKGGPVKGQKSDGKSSSGPNKDLISLSNITVSSTNFMDTVSQVLGLTAGFQTMLEVLKSGLACGDVENSSRDISRSAKTFETGLQQFLKQVLEIVNKANSKGKAENGDTEDDSIVSNGIVAMSEDEDLNKQKTVRKSHDRKSYTPVRVKEDSSYYGRSGQSKADTSVVEINDSNSEDEVDDLPISFGPSGASSSKAEKEAMDVSIEEPKPVSKPSKPSLGEAENEAAQLELLKELAEEMCKEQKERKEKALKDEEEKMEVEIQKTADEEPQTKNNEEPTKEAITSGESDSDDVSSSDLLMSSDGDVRRSRRRSRKKKDTRFDELKKERKKKEKKERKERRKAEKRKKEKKETPKKEKKKKKDSDDSQSEEDLDKLIDKFEEDPVMRKSRKKKEEESNSDKESNSSNEEKNIKKSSKSAGENKAQGKKKKAASSSSDDDDDAPDDVDEEDEEEEENKTKLKNGKDKKLENGNDIENEMAKAELMAEIEDDVDDANDDVDNDDDDSESDEKSKKGKPGKKGDKKAESKPKKGDDDGNEEDDEGEESGMDSGPSRRKRIRSKLLDAKISDSGSDSKQSKSKKKKKNDSNDSDSEEFVIKKRSRKKKKDSSSGDDSDGGKKKKKGKGKGKKKEKKGKKRKLGSGSDSSDLSSSSSEDSDSDVSLDTSEEERREKLKAERKAKRKSKRRRIKQQDDSSEEQKSDASSDEDHDDDDDDENRSPDKSGRKNIRKIKSKKNLTDATRKARKNEEARRKRVEERQKEFNHVVQIEGDVKECPITTQLVLEFDKETKKELLQVNKKLVRKLKPHQVEACKFMWDCLCEDLERMKKKEGSGCILAHCMGLGKTLSVISFVHTMLANEKLTKMNTALIVCPLNTVINWRNEWTMWFEEKDRLDIYEISGVKQNWPRAEYLKDWQEGGGIMIIGYEMYRNLTMGARIKNKKQKAIFHSTLVDPGPDLVVCDEGHILKNDSSAVSQALNKVRTRRRIVLTGTPLQNNLIEYHCMTSFVKPNLMGTRKEFLNRFVNPITNGQHKDSTTYDVKVMGRRAHVLHEMLAGCVQRRDYSALTKFLPPKFEFVISVRLTPKQIDLYQKYLDIGGINPENAQGSTKGARLFADYQNLMKIWTHPWVLKLAEIRAESKRTYDDSEDSFIDNSPSEDEGSMSEGSSNDSEKSKGDAWDESMEAGPSSGQRRSRRGKPPPEDSDKDEIVKDWKTKSRGGEGDSDSLFGMDDGPKRVSSEWWADYVQEEDENDLTLSGKLILLFEILRMCEEIGDKVLIFSQSLLSLDIIEYFLDYIDKQAQEEAHKKAMEEKEKLDAKEMEEEKNGDGDKKKDGEKNGEKDGEKKDGEEKDGEKKDGEKKDGVKKDGEGKEEETTEEFGKSWTKGADYFRMDGSTGPHLRSQWADYFNDPENYRARLFLISTRAGSLGINLVAANRVIIFDASWNPSHDVQSIFRVYRFGQTKPCYIYRFLAQGTMEEKIYERQVTKQSLSQRVVDEHQIDRHFTANDLSELYNFKPDRLDDPNREKVVHSLPKDVLLAELLKSKDNYITKFHEHDSLLENRKDQVLSEEDKKAAWEDYENERKGISNRVAQASTASGMGMFSPDNVMQIVQMVKMRFPNLPPDMFQAQVQAILQQQILYQQSIQKQQIEQQRMMEMQRLHRIQQDIRSQQRQINSMTRQQQPSPGASMMGNPRAPFAGRGQVMSASLRNMLTKPDESNPRSTTPNKPPTVIDLSNS